MLMQKTQGKGGAVLARCEAMKARRERLRDIDARMSELFARYMRRRNVNTNAQRLGPGRPPWGQANKWCVIEHGESSIWQHYEEFETESEARARFNDLLPAIPPGVCWELHLLPPESAAT